VNSPAPKPYRAFSSDGHVAQWTAWAGDGEEVTSLVWENEGWTVSGQVSRENVQYVLRLSPSWQVRQMLLFRDLDEPDLWLATDGGGRWGEMNGAHRTELDGCYDLLLTCTPFTDTIPIRRLPLNDGHTAELPLVVVDPETLDVQNATHRYTRLAFDRWRSERCTADGDVEFSVEFAVDEFGLVVDYPNRYRRVR
jgi:uncharacterized protein